ncbi:hypothetical protein AKJ36_00345 [candidate division MSBL1 archaeon SCGC-AAA259I07]|uniref:MGS-like domain-containing protein n=2 Tax=candidate division MSBL1 TaxID=215777 RepID=A0A133U922_9EURY|nr:hypothetical protein AKJ61_00130 [candidate division MSBL1 archaeon SCGC-AAA259B11]KXA95529.1 hypothetical protein AKJ36_00345 [candidate division MSBL1 archaeon SCGC-AAA259I07]
MIKSAIISVSDKNRLDELLDGLFEINPEMEILSSGGTAERIRELGYEATEVSTYTGFPEAPGGLVKTLHPKVHGGLLLDEDRVSERDYLKKEGIKTFGLVVCNLYPFEETVEKGKSRRNIIESIDIGGPTLIRSAAKGALRHGKTAPVIEPEDYGEIVEKLKENDGTLTRETRDYLAYKAFRHTCNYDQKIRNWTEKMSRGE